jgi:glycolate oxidase iron-sulfur subunit
MAASDRLTMGRERDHGSLAAALAAHDDRLSNCVHCGFCLPACPTYVRLGDEADSPRGRLHLMRAVAEGRLDPASDAFQRHIDRCLGCRACETVCPSGVEYGFLLEQAREVAGRARRGSWRTGLLLTLIRRPVPFRLWMAFSRAARWTGIPGLAARMAPAWRWLHGPRLAMGMLAASGSWSPPPRGAGEVARPARSPEPRQTRGRVAVLTGCIQDHLFRRVNAATVRTLEANGWEVVDVAGQVCCGALHAHAGHLSAARELALENVRAFRQAGVDFIVANAAGCGAAMRGYDHLLEGRDPPKEPDAVDFAEEDDATWFSGRVRDVSEVLAADGRMPRAGGALPLRVAYDPPCHLLHGQRVASPPLELLRSIPGLEVTGIPKGDECCGGAGIYGITHVELGGRIGQDKVNAVLSTEADVLATGNPGCAMQIGAGLRMRGSSMQVTHPIELLDESYRRGGIYGVGD